MLQIRKMDTEKIKEEGLIDVIIDFERENLHKVLAKADVPFDEERRRKCFEREMVVIMAFNEEQKLVGYLDFGPHQKRPKEIYVYSLQIAEDYRNGLIIYKLLQEVKKELLQRDFDLIRCNVHKTNQLAVNLYRKLGFTLEESSSNPKVYRAYAGRDIFDRKIFR